MADVTSLLVKGERFLAVNELKWEKSLSNLPKMSSDNITNFTKKTGKKEMGPKGYKLFAENYLHDVYTASSQQCQWVKGRCYRSQRKTVLSRKSLYSFRWNASIEHNQGHFALSFHFLDLVVTATMFLAFHTCFAIGHS